ncbi:MFS transporter [Acidisoma cellulosilytica]|uniref:MFS transporter n=1 Tax=Acidisoma cellulosilyticum TaxID=2802395 RepID=A0A964E650_9PROT|nr:MFS transporter [Acidisoma cellulosilyticum]MCB8883350.1 MFS transporter [Acidisoma cellulosilyticum]
MAVKKRIIVPLEALNFFMADMQSGIGPFLGIFLLAHHWHSGAIGTVMTLGGISGMLMTAPFGALIDATKRKRAYVAIPGACAVLASLLVLLSQNFWVIALSQVATAIAGAAIGPAVSGMSLGIVRQAGFPRQNGRNQVFNHAGNLVGASLSGYLGWRYGYTAVFWLAVVFGGLSIISVFLIPRDAIDDDAARGMKEDRQDEKTTSGFKVLVQSRPLLILAGALACFHLGNGALLPLYGLAVVSAHPGNPTIFVAETIAVAQAVMILASIIATRMAQQQGYWWILLVTFLALPIRGVVASILVVHWGVFPVQALDGIGAGLQSVAVPGLVARVLNGTGRVNVGQGAVMTIQGLGASISPMLGGWIAEGLGYRVTFVTLGSFALASIAIWLSTAKWMKPVCER